MPNECDEIARRCGPQSQERVEGSEGKKDQPAVLSVHTVRLERAVAVGEDVRLQWNTAELDLLVLAQGFTPVSIARRIFIFNEIGRGERI